MREMTSISLKGPTRVNWLDLLAYFFGSALLTNAIPHVVAGMMGESRFGRFRGGNEPRLT
jgi:hypothetical protein